MPSGWTSKISALMWCFVRPPSFSSPTCWLHCRSGTACSHPAARWGFRGRSYWIPRSYALALSAKGDSFVRLLKNKSFREDNMTQVGLYAIGTSTILESNKSLDFFQHPRQRHAVLFIQTGSRQLSCSSCLHLAGLRHHRYHLSSIASST